MESIFFTLYMAILTAITTTACIENRVLYNNSKTEVHQLKCKVDSLVVEATVYYPVKSQCDSTPHITADGTLLDTINPGKHRIVAVSRDLLTCNGGIFNYGDRIIVLSNNLSIKGVWTIHDTMHKRWKNKIDFLGVGGKIGKWSNLIIVKWKKKEKKN